MPCNAVTGRRYSGINILLLWGAVIERGYPSQGWLTFAQAQGAGGSIRKGERGTTVVYADRFTPEQERERARSEGDDPRTIPFLKRFTLFNIDQCDGLPERLAVAAPPLPERETLPVAEALIVSCRADFRIGGAEIGLLSGNYLAKNRQMPTIDQAEASRMAIEPISVRIPTAVAMTGFSRSRLYELIASGEIQIVKDGRCTLVLVTSLRAAIERRKAATLQGRR